MENNVKPTHTKGNVIVEEIKIGDHHYEYNYGQCVESIVQTLPAKNDDGNWVWKSKVLGSEQIIDYLVNPEYTQYSCNLYNHEAYLNKDGMKN